MLFKRHAYWSFFLNTNILIIKIFNSHTTFEFTQPYFPFFLSWRSCASCLLIAWHQQELKCMVIAIILAKCLSFLIFRAIKHVAQCIWLQVFLYNQEQMRETAFLKVWMCLVLLCLATSIWAASMYTMWACVSESRSSKAGRLMA